MRVPAWRRLRTAVGSLIGWQVGVPLGSFRADTFVDALRKAESLDLASVEGDSIQQVRLQIPKALDYRLAPGEIDFVNQRLNELNVRMPVYVAQEISEDEAIARRQFEFVKRIGVETIAVERSPKSLPAAEKLADEFGVNVALIGNPKALASALEGRGPRIGVYADVAKWLQEGISPTDAMMTRFKERVFAVKLGDHNTIVKLAPVITEIYKRGLKPSLVYDANIGYGGANGGHRSIPAGNMAIELFAKATGAFEPVFSNDLDNFRYDRIKTFDAVFLNNTVAQIFVDPEIRAGLSRFVREGGGLAGRLSRHEPCFDGLARVRRDPWRRRGKPPRADRDCDGEDRRPGEPAHAAVWRPVVRPPGRVLPVRRTAALAGQSARVDEHRHRQDRPQSGKRL